MPKRDREEAPTKTAKGGHGEKAVETAEKRARDAKAAPDAAPATGRGSVAATTRVAAPAPAPAPAPPAPAAGKGKEDKAAKKAAGKDGAASATAIVPAGTSETAGPSETAATFASLEGLQAASFRGGFGAKRLPYTNKQRVLIFSSRGVTARYRHLMEDLRAIIPHHKTESKVRPAFVRAPATD